MFWTLPLCSDAICYILQLTDYKRKALSAQIAEGLLQPKQKQHSMREVSKQQFLAADQMLQWLHEQVAENLAESVRVGTDRLGLLKVAQFASGTLPAAATVKALDHLEADGDEVKWLPPGTTLTEMKDLAQTFLPSVHCSYSTFCQAYHQKWERKLKVRVEGQHSKCTLCSRFKAYRRQQVSTPKDVAHVTNEYSLHIAEVMKDRHFDAALNLRSQISVGSVSGTVSDAETMLSIHMDAMDAAKFKLPRNLCASKEFQNLWRPELVFVCALVEGVCEHYVLVDMDTAKNADLQCTILGMVLEETMATLQARGKPMPRHLRVHTDNAAGEGKNQTMFYLAAWLAGRELFDSVTLSQFRV